MPTYKAPLADFEFILNDVLHLEKHSNLKGFDEAMPDVIGAILREGAKFAEEVLQPLNMKGDAQGCTRHADGSVTTPEGFRQAYKAFSEGGWHGIAAPKEYGGQGLPYALGIAVEEMVSSANLGFSLYPFLTVGVIALIECLGSEEQKKTFLPHLISGKWAGTMNLTEPHCGTDLRLIRTKAEPDKDGSYKINGTKIFISAGEHDLAENIIHLVLAKIPGGPEGIKGVSLFIVPKLIGGKPNGVSCGAIEEKMGLHGNATCVLNYEGAKGFLVGQEHEGMKNMFLLMNAARIGVGMQGLAVAEAACQNAANYARERLQGRALTGPKHPEKEADPIIVHADVRRMLMDGRAFTEGARALVLWAGLLQSLSVLAATPGEREEADDLLALLTPVIKGVLTDRAFDTATNAQQVLGGHGYIREWGMEQFVRDARITMIYEGANGVQAMDLVGRKLGQNGGRAVRRYFALLGGYIKDYGKDYPEFLGPLKAPLGDLEQATLWLAQHGPQNPDNAGAAAVPYMHLMGLVALGHMWAWMAVKAAGKLAAREENKDFYKAKLVTARHFMVRILPRTGALVKEITAGAETVMGLHDEAF